ncbi:N-acetylneuraminate synthase family protein [Dyadobacter sp. CY312]|uniref:N-acetylneuraminate synthase family protein n=1 Tax=Dyadobacter sp. CY312 TaxID=2907303 RepID=UPI001F3C1DEF|nr:N-acetylneuraminate synthase family protein [Dyadobacter sp. CY312]MCE7041961.1 N-acetylneuraminate synthase family protein [Dyadobacter sp. CY312]
MNSAIYMIGEIGQAHEGSFGVAHSYIDVLAESGVDAVKFQTHISEAESSEHETFRIPFPYSTETRMEYWERMEFTPEQWSSLKNHCEDHDMDFLATPSCIQAVELLEKIGVSRYKVGSGDTYNLLLLERIAKTGKEMIISTGMSSQDELDLTCQFLKQRNTMFSLLQCTSAYPTRESQWGLNQIAELRSQYNVPTGFSDHSGDIYACLAATALGAEILEFHVTFDKRSYGPDSASSLTIDQVKMLTTGVRQISTANTNPVNKADISGFQDVKNIFEKSLAVNKDLPAGHVITLHDLESKKPKGMGIPVHLYEQVLGKRLSRDMKKWMFLNETDIL